MFCDSSSVLWVGLRCVIVVFPDHTNLLFVFLTFSYFYFKIYTQLLIRIDVMLFQANVIEAFKVRNGAKIRN